MAKASASLARAGQAARNARPMRRRPPAIDFSDIPEASPAQLRAMRRVGRPPLAASARRLIAIRIDPQVLEAVRREAKRREASRERPSGDHLEVDKCRRAVREGRLRARHCPPPPDHLRLELPLPTVRHGWVGLPGLRDVGDERFGREQQGREDRKSTRLNSSHVAISYAVFCLKKKKTRRSA